MRMEVHVHGTIHLRPDVRLADINEALQPWLEYLDVGSIEEASSLHHDEPGIYFDSRECVLDICWSGEVGRSFGNRVEPAIRSLCALSEAAAEVEITFYDDDGHDEMNIVFVGPTPASIHDAQRRRMSEDVAHLLGRHFDQPAIDEVVTLLNDLFKRDWQKHSQNSNEVFSAMDATLTSKRRQLH